MDADNGASDVHTTITDDTGDSSSGLLHEHAEKRRATPALVPMSIDQRPHRRPASRRQFSCRAVSVGLAVGGVLCFSNMFFGLETGWVTMGSLQSSVLGFGVFRALQRFAPNFTPLENVVLQTVAVATATMPLAAGFVGIIPALATLEEGSVDLSLVQLGAWAFGVAFFGVCFAVPLRKQTIVVEQLSFPSGTATAQMIAALHKTKLTRAISGTAEEVPPPHESEGTESWELKWKVLTWTFIASAVLTLLSHFFPVLRAIPLMSYVGASSITAWGWTLTPSLSYVGQGMIMGPRTGVSMFLGSVLGWIILGPLAKQKGWAPGKITSYHDGARGWVLWVALAIMMGDSITSLLVLVGSSIRKRLRPRTRYMAQRDVETTASEALGLAQTPRDPVPPSELVPFSWWSSGLAVSCAVCAAISSAVFSLPVYESAIAVVLALLVAILAVRALGETDLNPVSGVGKLSQAVFALVSPGNVVSNLVAGAIAEAGAQQAGDLMQDLKTGHLLGAAPRAQFFGQILGSAVSVVFSVAAYALFTSAYEVPGPVLMAPSAQIWTDMARLVNGGGLAQHVQWFCIAGAAVSCTITLLRSAGVRGSGWLPSGVAMAVGAYLSPNWTIPRLAGSLLQWYWFRKNRWSHDQYMVLVASGFVLGEGVTAIVNALMNTGGLRALSCFGCAEFVCGGVACG